MILTEFSEKLHCKHKCTADLLTAEYTDRKQNSAKYQDQNGKLLSKIIQIRLKWRLFFRSRFQKSRNLSNLCLHSYIRYNRSATPICDKASGKQLDFFTTVNIFPLMFELVITTAFAPSVFSRFAITSTSISE